MSKLIRLFFKLQRQKLQAALNCSARRFFERRSRSSNFFWSGGRARARTFASGASQNGKGKFGSVSRYIRLKY